MAEILAGAASPIIGAGSVLLTAAWPAFDFVDDLGGFARES
jgi:hypothetical protein